MSEFEQNVIGVWGEEGKRWLKSLPSLAENISIQWGIENIVSLKNLSYNYVFQGIRTADKLQVIVKLGCDAVEFGNEVNALKSYQSCGGSVPILDVDYNHQAFLMPNITPGCSLATLFPEQDDLAIGHACRIIRNLHSVNVCENIQWPMLEQWLTCFDHVKSDALPNEHLKKAKKFASSLLEKTTSHVLLHGDLHYNNILQYGESWLSIDPKGVVGDAAFEVSNVCVRRNGTDALSAPKMLHRFELFAKNLNMDLNRITRWAYVQAIMSACWSMQDNGDPSHSIKVASILKNCLFD